MNNQNNLNLGGTPDLMNQPSMMGGVNMGQPTVNPTMQQPMSGMGMMPADVSQVPAEISEQGLTAYKQQLRLLPEVQQLTSQIEVQNPNSIILFGQQASEEISKVSDELLNSIRSVKSEEASEMLVSLTKIMDKFDISEIENAKGEAPSLAAKLFKNIGNTVAKMFQKYDTMGYEVEQVHGLLKKYEMDIKEANANLKRLADANVHFYRELERYVVAGELAVEELDLYINQVSSNYSMAEEERTMMVQKLTMCKEMLQQRIYDLQIAENVAIQAAPMIQTIQMSNFNLMRKINSSFVVTLPIFKQCLAQAIILKRQEIQAKSIQQLDDKTNELIVRNAQRTASQSVAIAKMASGSSLQIENLRKSYETIMNGIQETRQIQEQNAEERKQNAVELERMKQGMRRNGFGA
mgnify:CR=1 FL=1